MRCSDGRMGQPPTPGQFLLVPPQTVPQVQDTPAATRNAGHVAQQEVPVCHGGMVVGGSDGLWDNLGSALSGEALFFPAC